MRRRAGSGRAFACLFLAVVSVSLLASQYFSLSSTEADVALPIDSPATTNAPFLRLGALQSAPHVPLVDASTLRQALDEDPIHIVHSYCIYEELKPTDPGLTVLRSILAARATGASKNRRYVFHIIADEFAAWLLSNNHSATMPWGKRLESPASLIAFHKLFGDVIAHIDNSGGRVELQIHPEEDAFAAAEDALGEGATLYFNHDGFKRCSPLRLLIPFIPAFANVSKALFLDLDVAVLCDIEQMWDLFDEWTEDMWLGIAPEAKNEPLPGEIRPTHATMPCAPQYGWYGVNNGAMMWRIDRIRAHLAEYWAEVMRIVNEKAYRSARFSEFHASLTENIMKHPDDQDIMGIASYDWPHRFYKLSQRFNWRWKLGRDFQPSAWGAEPGVCVEHFSNSDFNVDIDKGRAGMFAYWRDYRRVAPGTAKRLDRGPGTPQVPWNWEIGTGRSLGPLHPKKK